MAMASSNLFASGYSAEFLFASFIASRHDFSAKSQSRKAARDNAKFN
jgi:hypothetical protein